MTLRSLYLFLVSVNSHFVLACCCLLCVCMLLSFLFVHWYFFPILCMIAFHCGIFPFWAWCCLLYEFIAPSSFCHLHFVLVFCKIISFHFGMQLSFNLGVLLSFLFIHWYFLVFPTLCMIAFHCGFPPFEHGAVLFMTLLFLLLFVICISSQVFVILVPFVSACCCLFVLLNLSSGTYLFPHFAYDCVSMWGFPFVHGSVFLSVCCSIFVIRLFVYDCISLWFVYFVIFWVCCCLSYSSMVCFIYPIKTIAFCCICCTWVFSFRHAVVFPLCGSFCLPN